MARRSYGTGHLYEKGGAWYGRWRDPAGAQLNRKVGAKRHPGERDGLTKPQAEKALRQMMETEAVAVRASARTTVADAGAALVRRLEAKGAKKSYVETVESVVRVHLSRFPQFRAKDLAAVTQDDVERYIAQKRWEGKSAKTIRNHLGVLHAIFELGQRRRWCSGNPVKLAEGPHVRRNATRIRFLSQDELEALLRAPYPDDAYGAIEASLYLTAAMTGLRQNELFALRWRGVDWVSQRIRVVDGYVRREFNDPKSERSARSVPMATPVARELERLFQRSPWHDDDDLVFAHPETGKPLDASKVLKRLKGALRRADVREVTFHELRHTFGTQCAANGIPQRTIQEWLGHTDPKTTSIYRHYAPAARDVALLDEAFGTPACVE